MNQDTPLYYDDLNIKLHFGNYLINIFYIRYEPPCPTWNVPNHFHTGWELHFIPSGNGWLQADKNSFELDQDTFYLTGPNIYHEQRTNQTHPMCEFSISFEINAVKTKKKSYETYNDNESLLIISAFQETNLWVGHDEYASINLFENIFAELKNKQVGYCFNVESIIAQIIVNAARSCMQQKSSPFTAPVTFTDDKRRAILDFYFGEHYKTLTFEELMDHLGVSSRQLNRIIKQYYHTTFKEKLLTIRLENAMHLLETTHLPVEKVSENTGFLSIGHFYRAFKKYTQYTPNEFRKKSKAESPAI